MTEQIRFRGRQSHSFFDVDRSVVTKHLSTIFNEGELDKNSTCAKEFAENEFEKFRVVQDSLYQSDFNKLMKGLQNDESLQ